MTSGKVVPPLESRAIVTVPLPTAMTPLWQSQTSPERQMWGSRRPGVLRGSGVLLLLLLLLHGVVTPEHLGQLVRTRDDRCGVEPAGLSGQPLDRP